MKKLRWFLWAVRGLWPLSDEKYRAWIAKAPGHEPAPAEIEGQPLTPNQWKSYNHRFVSGGGGVAANCFKCGMNEAFPIHWIAQELADHVARGGSPAEFRMPSHPFWRRSSINACGMCGREEEHIYHEGPPIVSTVERTDDHGLASPLPGASRDGSALDREGV